MILIVENSIFRFDHARGAGLEFAGIQVSVEAREIAAGDFEAKFMAGQENVAGGVHFNFDFVDFARVRQFGSCPGIAVTQAKDSFADVLSKSVGPDIDEFSGEIGVDGGRSDIEVETDRASDLEIFLKRCGGVNKNILATFDGSLVEGTGWKKISRATKRAAGGRDGVCGVVDELVAGTP